ncbi:MAG: class I SAM-dependent methyltransferase [Solirubrobacterales bacterium]|nr:class I SAM-dependent methyltransferase [Solirubrobacterales bacterium]
MTATRKEAEAAADRIPGSRLSARLYEPVLWLGEKTGLGRWRQKLVSQVSGAVLELGAGTGLNLPHYPEGLERLVLVEPEIHKARMLAGKVPSKGVKPEILRAPGEMLPFEDDSFDTVIETLVLCTVADPAATMAEIRRVLKPGGQFLFLEHVRSEKPRLGRLQDRLEKPWMKVADGCHCNRRTIEMMRANGFEVEVAAEQDRFPMPPVARPLVSGSARPLL